MPRKKASPSPALSPIDMSPAPARKKTPAKAPPAKPPRKTAKPKTAKKAPKQDPIPAAPSVISTSLDDLRMALPADMQPEPAPEGWQAVPLPSHHDPKAADPLAELLRVRCPDCACPDCPVIEGASRALKGDRVRHSHACRNCGREFMHVHQLPNQPGPATSKKENDDDDEGSSSQDPASSPASP